MANQGVQKYFFHTKNAVTFGWKDLAYFLEFDNPEISNIEGRNRDDKARCMDLLQEWKKKKGNAATTEVLMRALYNAGLAEVVDDLVGRYPELAVYQMPPVQPPREQPTMVQPHPAPRVQPSQVPGGQPSHWDEPASQGEKKLFIVHGGEDKDTLVEPLAQEIVQQGMPQENVFFDKWSIGHTQGIKQSIASAIHDSSCKLAVIVISEDMMKKYWPKREFEEFLKRGIRFFPIFYGVNPADVRTSYSPTLADTRGKKIPRTGDRVDGALIAETVQEILASLQEPRCSYTGSQDVMMKYFKVIAKEMPADWQQLAVDLGLPWAQIRAVNQQHSNNPWASCHEVLDMWRKTNGRDATKEDLIKAVSDTGNQEVADKLKDL
ncbi:positive regulation of MHC class I biosynthetic process [Branchiostoma belcheri]|nr:positive regulation of MHC class I biosynthetic process [Branchiostoma belcheri]